MTRRALSRHSSTTLPRTGTARLLAAASCLGLPSRGLTLTSHDLCLRCRTADALFKSSAEQLFPSLVDSLVKTINHSLTQYQGELLFHLRTRPSHFSFFPLLLPLTNRALVCGLQSTECMRRTRRCEVALAAVWLPSPRLSSPTKTNSASWAFSGSTASPRHSGFPSLIRRFGSFPEFRVRTKRRFTAMIADLGHVLAGEMTADVLLSYEM